MHNDNFSYRTLSETQVTCANFSQNVFPISVTLFVMSSTGFLEHLLQQKTQNIEKVTNIDNKSHLELLCFTTTLEFKLTVITKRCLKTRLHAACQNKCI